METPATNNMETPTTSAGQDSFGYVSVGDDGDPSKTFCKCGEGWACVVTKTEEPAATNAFFKCAEKCTCLIDTKTEGDSKTYALKSPGAGMAICRVGEGYTCVITKTTGPDAGKTFVECGGGCTCMINGP
ncbi:hypothetical protein AAG906_034224 [Vitis piasezkii]